MKGRVDYKGVTVMVDAKTHNNNIQAVRRWHKGHAPESVCEQNRVTIKWAREIPKDSDITGLEEEEGWRDCVDEDVVIDGGNEETSSTVQRSCHAGQSRAVRLLQTAWCQSRRSSGCTQHWGRNGCPKSNSSRSRHDSKSRAEGGGCGCGGETNNCVRPSALP